MSTVATERCAKRKRRIPLSFRINPDLHDELISRTAVSGRSKTQEAEFLLEVGLLVHRLVQIGLLRLEQPAEMAE